MDSKLFVACIARLHPLQAVYLTFNNGGGGIVGLRRLIALAKSTPTIQVEGIAFIELQAVLQSGLWENISRTVTVYGLAHADEDSLVSIARDLERIAAGEHFAKGIFTSNKAKQLAAVTTIIGAVLNRSLLDEVKSWGARVDGRLEDIDGIPAVTFTLFNVGDNEELVKVTVDGWSGRTAIDGVWGDRRCSLSSQIGELVYSALTDRLDRLTKSV
jgi:hypothetical protein